MRRILRLWMWAWPLLAGTAFAAAVMSMRGVTSINLAAARISMGNPWRPLLLAIILAAIEVLLALRERRRLLVPGAALVLSFVLSVILIPQSAPHVEAFADGAVFELHTRNALHGQQVLGAYSQFG